jgi:uncharacterized protein YdeI (YjbR/CyaY-like superfamily)
MKPKFFKSQSEFREWLNKNYDKEDEVWIGIYKKASGKEGINYDQALDEALCFGWIDGIVKKYDEDSYMQRFTPRRPKSNWSKNNVNHIERLTKEGKMMPFGLAAVEAAKKDGRWDAAYHSPANMVMPEDFLAELKKNQKAREFFETLNKANKYYIGYQLQSAKKDETRERRKKKIIKMLEQGKKFIEPYSAI